MMPFRLKSYFSPLCILVFWASGGLLFGQYEDADEAESLEEERAVAEEQRREWKDQAKRLAELLNQPFPIRRLVDVDDVKIRLRSIRLSSGEKATLVYGIPKRVKAAPAVFIMDVEAMSMADQPIRRYSGSSRGGARRALKTNYLLRSPFGSNLLGQGFVVAYLLAEDLETLRSGDSADWMEAFDRVRGLPVVDDNSFFLFSTREYANLGVYLAGKYPFSGFILEEPHYMLFSRETYDDVIRNSDNLSSTEIWQRTDPSNQEKYVRVFRGILSPILLIRAENTHAFAFNDKTLLPKLFEANAYVESLILERPARVLKTMGAESGVMSLNPVVRYHVPSVSTWLEQMVYYLRENSYTQPQELKVPKMRLGPGIAVQR